MTPSNITVGNIIRTTVAQNEEANPFSDDFDLNKFNELLKLDLEHFSKTHTITDNENLSKLVDVIIQLNSVYIELMTEIELLIEEINLEKISLIELIISLTNFDYLNLLTEQRKSIASSKSIHTDTSESLKTKNIFGDSIDIQDAVDVSADVCNQLINIILEFSPKVNKDLKPLSAQNKFNLTRKLMITTNLLFNIKNSVNIFREEFGDVIKEDEIIKFKDHPIAYSALKFAGKQRESSLIQEASFRTKGLQKKQINIPDFSIEKGTMFLLNQTKQKQDIFHEFSLAVQTTFYFHLHLKTLNFNGKASIDDVFNLLVAFRTFLQTVNADKIIGDAMKNQSHDFIPIKIEKQRLVQYLQKETSIKKKTIEALLNSLSQSFSESVNLWKKPLISYKNVYYFIFAPLAHGHLTYQADHAIEKAISKEKQEKYFTELLTFELSHEIANNYKLNRIDPQILERLGVKSSTVLVYETNSTVIILETCLFNFCIDSRDYSDALEKLAKPTEKLHNYLKIISANLNQISKSKIEDFIPIIATNHTSLSGLNIEGVFVLDSYLLKNYLRVGELKRAVVAFEDKKVESREVSSFKYYTSELEFGNNFRKYCENPFPIQEIIKKLKSKEIPIVHKEMQPQIYRDSFEVASLESSFWTLVNEAEYLLKQLYYFEKSFKEDNTKADIQKRLNYILPQVFSFIAIDSESRNNRIDVVNVFKATGVVGMTHLIFSLNTLIKELPAKKIQKDSVRDDIKIDYKKAEKTLNKLLKENLTDKASLSTLTLKHSLSKEELENVTEYLIDILSSFNPRYCSDKELENFYISLTIFVPLVNGNKTYHKHITSACLNLIDQLNLNHHYQKARDLCEEILEFSFKNEKPPLLGWHCLFRCYIKQNNVFDAAFYGCLYLSSLMTSINIQAHQVVDAIYNGMLFFRDFGYTELSENLYEAISSLSLDEYDRQKITLSHYFSKLTNSIESIDVTLKDANEFLSKNLDSILKYNQKGALPWAVFIYNLKMLHSKGFIKDISVFESYFKKLSEKIDKDTLSSLESTFFPLDTSTKLIYKDSLSKVLETRSIDDFTSELSKLELLAKNVAILSVQPMDIDNLLLSGIVINDNTLTFMDRELTESHRTFASKEVPEILKGISSYSSKLVSELVLRKGQLFCWVFQIYNNCYVLTIDHDKTVNIKQLNKWSLKSMHDWLNNISKFFFDDKGDYPINMQEQDYSKTLTDLSFANLEIDQPFEELLISTSLPLSTFPHNLFQNSSTSQKNITLHEDLIKETIAKNGSDFLSFHAPIANVITLEWFIRNNKDCEYKKSDLSIEAWIPVVDEDIVVTIGHEKLKPVIEKNNGKIYTELLPEKALSSSINVFLAHGDRGIEGFRTLYTKHTDGHAFIKKTGIEKLFGKGTVAILFVCNSASISQEIYAQRLVAFTHEILSLGYKAVIAPAWSLNPDLSGVWLSKFLECIQVGLYLNEAVFQTNVFIAKNGYNDYHGFYAPTGWAAMHLYGNPNIVFK